MGQLNEDIIGFAKNIIQEYFNKRNFYELIAKLEKGTAQFGFASKRIYHNGIETERLFVQSIPNSNYFEISNDWFQGEKHGENRYFIKGEMIIGTKERKKLNLMRLIQFTCIYSKDKESVSMVHIRDSAIDSNVELGKGKRYFDNLGKHKNLTDYALDHLLYMDGNKNTINIVLKKILLEFNLSRISVFILDKNELKMKYESYSDGVEPLLDKIVSLRLFENEHFSNHFSSCGIYYSEDCSSLLLFKDAVKYYEMTNVKSLLQIELLKYGIFNGYISFDDCRKRIWTNEEINRARLLTGLIGLYLSKKDLVVELEKEKVLVHEIADNQNLFNYIVKPDSYEIIFMSERCKQLFNKAEIGQKCYNAIMLRNSKCEKCPVLDINEKKKKNTVEIYNSYLDTWISSTASSIELSETEKGNLICCCDVSGFIARLTSKDTLTGLSTLSKFQLEASAVINRKSQKKYALVYMDFDKFKYINEVSGYSTGNSVLIQFSEIISDDLNNDELLCRSSADHFIALLEYDNDETLRNRLEEINHSVSIMQKKYFSNLKITIISGVYRIRSMDSEINTIIDRANLARKTMKGSHKSQIVFYDHELHLKILKEKEIESRMNAALENNNFLVYLQPKVDLKTSEIVGAEALVRWEYEDGNIISPIEFIPIFEKNGFIVDLDFYVYEVIFKTMKSWLENNKKVVPISVNVSRIHINDERFVDKLSTLVNKYKIPANLIELELTESIFLENFENLITIINRLRGLGYTFSIDDFGSGYSSLNLLKDLPIDVLKLDKEFFPHESIEGKEKVVVSNIIRMAKELDIEVLSEGVETINQAELLALMGCDMAQGFLFYKPMSISEFEKKLYFD